MMGRLSGFNTYTIDGVSARFRYGSEAFRHRSRFKGEAPCLREVLNEVEAKDVFWDVGANTGLYTCFVADICDVIAFEPFPPNVEALTENIELNGQVSSVDVRSVALSNTEDTVTLNVPDDASVAHGTGSIDINQHTEGVSVRTLPGDKLISDYEVPAPSVVKIDVEGAEGMVMDGLRNALRERVHTVFCEVHDAELSSYTNEAMDPEMALRDLGFSLHPIKEEEHRRFLKAKK